MNDSDAGAAVIKFAKRTEADEMSRRSELRTCVPSCNGVPSALLSADRGSARLFAIIAGEIDAADDARNAWQSARSIKPSITTMVNLCALQGVSVTEMLIAPQHAGSTPLLDLWSGYSALPIASESRGDEIKIGYWLLRKLLARCGGLYLPNMLYALDEAGISRVVLRNLSPDLYETYERHYRSQAAPVKEYRLAEAFRAALVRFRGSAAERLKRQIQWQVPAYVAELVHLSVDEATPACWSALVYERLVRRAREQLGNVSLDAMVDTRWIHTPPAD